MDVYAGARNAERGQQAVDEIGTVARLLISLDTGSTPDDTDLDTFRRTYETNVFGVAAVINAFLPLLRRSARPRIVNIFSGTGSLTWSTGPNPQFTFGSGGGAAYRSSKTALNALTVFYALDLAGAGIKVNALAPGLRATALTRSLRPAAAIPPTQPPAPSAWRYCRTTDYRLILFVGRHRGAVVARKDPMITTRCALPAACWQLVDQGWSIPG